MFSGLSFLPANLLHLFELTLLVLFPPSLTNYPTSLTNYPVFLFHLPFLYHPSQIIPFPFQIQPRTSGMQYLTDQGNGSLCLAQIGPTPPVTLVFSCVTVLWVVDFFECFERGAPSRWFFRASRCFASHVTVLCVTPVSLIRPNPHE